MDLESSDMDADIVMKYLKSSEMDADTVAKYMKSSQIVNKAMKLLVMECVPNANIAMLCSLGDDLIIQETAKVKEVGVDNKGVAFPTCVSVNNCVKNFSPLIGDETILQYGDTVKLELASHIDGYIAVLGHTICLFREEDQLVTGSAADVIGAASKAAEVASRLLRPGKKIQEVTNAIKKIAHTYECKTIPSMTIHLVDQYMLDLGSSLFQMKTGIDDSELDLARKDMEGVSLASRTVKEIPDGFGEPDVCSLNRVYVIDVGMTTGQLKIKIPPEKKPTIFKASSTFSKWSSNFTASRNTAKQIQKKFPRLPFTARAFGEEFSNEARLGLSDLSNKKFVDSYCSSYEEHGKLVARFKYTILMGPEGPERITHHPVQDIKTTKAFDDAEISRWMMLPTMTKKKGGGKKKKKKVCYADAEAVIEVRAEVDQLWKQVTEIEAGIRGGNKFDDQIMLDLTVMLETQLKELDKIEDQGEGMPKENQVRRVKNLVFEVEMLRHQNAELN